MTAVKTQTDTASAKDASKAVCRISATSAEVVASVTTEPTAAAVSEQQPEASAPSSTAVIPLTIGEMVEKHLRLNRISKKSEKGAVFVCHKCMQS